ncbi:MAG TPA: hypothetical protein VL346_06305 [Acidobacteriaceae bacterium]|nr:hypothetical protein [Acidobacteriaceae bacterium]
MAYRDRLIHDSVVGNKWRSEDGKRVITDRDMVELSTRLHGWSKNVYAFGCAFIHLSAFHDYSDRDPFDQLRPNDRRDIVHYLNYYHGFAAGDSTGFLDIVHLLPGVFNKIADNLECYVGNIESRSHLRI